jgi:hypothetical protein
MCGPPIKVSWKKAVILDAYLGSFSSKQIPIEITLTDENGNLTYRSTHAYF